MKLRLTMAAALMALTTTAAPAAEHMVSCTIKTDTGNTVKYHFIPAGDGVVAEVAVSRNGWVRLHDPKDRPLWSTAPVPMENQTVLAMTYRADNRYVLFITIPTNGRRAAAAQLDRAGFPIGGGHCINETNPEPTHGYFGPGEGRR
jgi:hypothetical protein